MLTIGVIAGVVLILAVWQRRSIRRLFAAGGAQFGKLSRWAWGMDPIAIYQAEVDKAAEEIQEAGAGLEQFKGHVARLQREVANGLRKVEDLTAKVKAMLLAGNEAKATSYVLELQTVQAKLEKDQKQLTEQELLYQTNLKKVKYANQKIREAKEKTERMQSELRLSNAEAEVARLAQNFEIKTSSIDNLGEIEDEIQRQIDANRSKGQVIHDLGNDGLEEMEHQEQIERGKAKLMLDKFKQELLPAPNIEVKILPPVGEHERN